MKGPSVLMFAILYFIVVHAAWYVFKERFNEHAVVYGNITGILYTLCVWKIFGI